MRDFFLSLHFFNHLYLELVGERSTKIYRPRCNSGQKSRLHIKVLNERKKMNHCAWTNEVHCNKWLLTQRKDNEKNTDSTWITSWPFPWGKFKGRIGRGCHLAVMYGGVLEYPQIFSLLGPQNQYFVKRFVAFSSGLLSRYQQKRPDSRPPEILWFLE